MKFHYKGKYNLDPNTLPTREHEPNYVKFKEPEDSKKFAIIANIGGTILSIVFFAISLLRINFSTGFENINALKIIFALVVPSLFLFPHELLHAICFKKDVYMYTNFSQGMVFVVGTEDMSKARFIFMSLLPNLVFGIIPFIIGMIFPQAIFLLFFGAISISMGFGDYFNIFNAITQMPKGSRTYLSQFNSYWYIPKN